jgi:hypothetical protein
MLCSCFSIIPFLFYIFLTIDTNFLCLLFFRTTTVNLDKDITLNGTL